MKKGITIFFIISLFLFTVNSKDNIVFAEDCCTSDYCGTWCSPDSGTCEEVPVGCGPVNGYGYCVCTGQGCCTDWGNWGACTDQGGGVWCQTRFCDDPINCEYEISCGCTPGDDDDCTQPCGSCFDGLCGACSITVGKESPESTPLMLSFGEAKFGKATQEEIASCQNSLIGTVKASSTDREIVLSSLNTPIWKLALLDTYKWMTDNKSLLIIAFGVLALISIFLKSTSRNI